MKLVVTVPIPPRELHPNGRPHWAKKARAAKVARRQGHDAARLIMFAERMRNWSPLWDRAEISAVFYVKDRRGLKQDQDNAVASLKNYCDGIADAGVVVNDRCFVWKSPPVAFEADKIGRPRVEITITPSVKEGK